MGRIHDDIRPTDAGKYECREADVNPQCMERGWTTNRADDPQLADSGPKFSPAAVADHRHGARIRHAAGWIYVASAASPHDGISNAAGNGVAVFRAIPAQCTPRYGAEDGQPGPGSTRRTASSSSSKPSKCTSSRLATISGFCLVSRPAASDDVPDVPGYERDASIERGSVPDVFEGRKPDELPRATTTNGTTGPGGPYIQLLRRYRYE